MSRIPLQTATSAPAASQDLLGQVQSAFGATPNMFKAVANSPAALASMWGSFGALGKGQLVANSAGLIRRSGRLHLLGPPYAALMRRTIAARLGLKPQADDARTDAAIDRALSARGLSDTPFAALAARLASARKPHELLRAADALKSIERKLG